MTGGIFAKPDVPAHVVDTVTHYADLLGLKHWRIFIELVDRIGTGDSDGEMTLTHNYFIANLCLRRDLLTEHAEFLSGALLHELWHVVMAPQDQAVHEIIALLETAAPKLAPVARRLWERGDEQTTEWLARTLIGVLPPVPEAPRA